MHFDVLGGSFSNDYMMSNKLLSDIKSISHIANDYHLMIRDPEAYIGELAAKPADIITVHWEFCSNMDKVLELLKNKGCKVGIAINVGTPVNHREAYCKDIDVVLIILTRAGKMGNEFQEASLEKITQVKQMANKQGTNILIEADGGVGKKIIPELKKFGMDIFVGGSSSLFLPHMPFDQAYQEFKEMIFL